MGVQVWRQPKQAKKGKKGAELTSSAPSEAASSLSADIDTVHNTLSGGVKVSTGLLSCDKVGQQ